jgi:hypothetical protein
MLFALMMLIKHLNDIETHIANHDTISLRDMFDIIGDDCILILLILLSVFNIVLSPLPANSYILGAPLVVLSALYWGNIGFEKLKWPFFFKKISCASWRPYLKKSHAFIHFIDRWTDPRWPRAFWIENRMNTGFSLVFMNLVVFLPIPFMNIPGSIATICLACGIMERDGVLVSIGYGIMAMHILSLIALKTAFFG